MTFCIITKATSDLLLLSQLDGTQEKAVVHVIGSYHDNLQSLRNLGQRVMFTLFLFALEVNTLCMMEYDLICKFAFIFMAVVFCESYRPFLIVTE